MTEYGKTLLGGNIESKNLFECSHVWTATAVRTLFSLSLTTGISAQSCNFWKNNLKDCMVLMSIWDGQMIEKWEELHSTDIIPEN